MDIGLLVPSAYEMWMNICQWVLLMHTEKSAGHILIQCLLSPVNKVSFSLSDMSWVLLYDAKVLLGWHRSFVLEMQKVVLENFSLVFILDHM